MVTPPFFYFRETLRTPVTRMAAATSAAIRDMKLPHGLGILDRPRGGTQSKPRNCTRLHRVSENGGEKRPPRVSVLAKLVN
jgi:hypothetical protein